MKGGEGPFIWQATDWPRWRYDLSPLVPLLAEVSRAQGILLGRLQDVGLASRDLSSLAALTEDVVRTSEIEGERLDVLSVRSSLARRLGLDIGASAPTDRHIDGVVDMVLDATSRCNEALSTKRLFEWHSALFPSGRSGLRPLQVGPWRDDARGPMQVVSGRGLRERLHFQAPPASALPHEIDRFLAWANAEREPTVLDAGLAHLWFVTLHPFDDGNGRIARAIGDLFLARAERSPRRFYSVSAQIQRERRAYYDILEKTQRGTLDVTSWLAWFLDALRGALSHAEGTLDGVLERDRFFRRWAGTPLSDRQVKVLRRLLDGFEGKLTSSKWATLAKCSPDTALRDISELVGLGILRRSPGGGRSTSYELA